MALQSTLSHKSTHATGGTDALTPSDIGAESTITTLPVSKGGTGSTTEAGALTALGAVAKAGDTMGGKLIAAADDTASKLNIGNAITGTSPATTANGDLWVTGGNRMAWRSGGVSYNSAATNLANSFNQAQTISISGGTATALKINNLGTGDCLRIEDETPTPDTTPFVVSASGRVGAGVEPDAAVALSVDSTGIKFGDGTIQTTAAVTSISAGTTGLTPATATTGAVTLAGTLAIANGGTGATTAENALVALGAEPVFTKQSVDFHIDDVGPKTVIAGRRVEVTVSSYAPTSSPTLVLPSTAQGRQVDDTIRLIVWGQSVDSTIRLLVKHNFNNAPVLSPVGGLSEGLSLGSSTSTTVIDLKATDGYWYLVHPALHKSTHATGGADALTPADIGATAIGHTHAIADTTSLQDALDIKVNNYDPRLTAARFHLVLSRSQNSLFENSSFQGTSNLNLGTPGSGGGGWYPVTGNTVEGWFANDTTFPRVFNPLRYLGSGNYRITMYVRVSGAFNDGVHCQLRINLNGPSTTHSNLVLPSEFGSLRRFGGGSSGDTNRIYYETSNILSTADQWIQYVPCFAAYGPSGGVNGAYIQDVSLFFFKV